MELLNKESQSEMVCMIWDFYCYYAHHFGYRSHSDIQLHQLIHHIQYCLLNFLDQCHAFCQKSF